MSETGQTHPATTPPDRPDQWHDFRRGIALLSMVLFFFCVVGLGFLVYQLAVSGGDGAGIFDGWSFFRFLAVAAPLGVAAVMGLGVYRASSNAKAKRCGRAMGLSLLIAAVLLVVTGVIGDRLS